MQTCGEHKIYIKILLPMSYTQILIASMGEYSYSVNWVLSFELRNKRINKNMVICLYRIYN